MTKKGAIKKRNPAGRMYGKKKERDRDERRQSAEKELGQKANLKVRNSKLK